MNEIFFQSKAIGLALALMAVFGIAQGQTGDTFVNLRGTAGAFAVRNDSAILAENPIVRFVLDDQDDRLTFRWLWSEFQSDDSVFAAVLYALPSEMIFRGKTELRFLARESEHPKSEFEVNGEIEMDGIRHSQTIDVTVDHVGISEDIACRVWITFDLDLEAFEMSKHFPQFYQFIHFESIFLIPEGDSKY